MGEGLAARVASLALAWLLAAACSSPPTALEATRSDGAHAIFVVRRALHTGIALRVGDLAGSRLHALAGADAASAVEFGWGDAAYYQADERSLWLALGTVFPSESVMSVLALPEVSRARARGYEAIELPVTAAELRAVLDAIEGSFATNAPVPTGRTRRSEAGELRFYEANGAFHLLRMCNRWTTDLLRRAGCSLRPLPVLSPHRAMREARRCTAARSEALAARRPPTN